MLCVQTGDKVQLKTTKAFRKRGVVLEIRGEELRIRLEDSNKLVSVAQSEVTNYSLAARKAWKKMPNRRVGRPKGSRKSDRISVTLRIDRQLWDQFCVAESNGYITDRTQVINEWMQEKLDELSS